MWHGLVRHLLPLARLLNTTPVLDKLSRLNEWLNESYSRFHYNSDLRWDLLIPTSMWLMYFTDVYCSKPEACFLGVEWLHYQPSLDTRKCMGFYEKNEEYCSFLQWVGCSRKWNVYRWMKGNSLGSNIKSVKTSIVFRYIICGQGLRIATLLGVNCDAVQRDTGLLRVNTESLVVSLIVPRKPRLLRKFLGIRE